MSPSVLIRLLLFLLFLSLPAWLRAGAADGKDFQSASATPVFKPAANHGTGPSKDLVIHKPMPSPSWGKVIQYHREQVLPPSDKNHETLHEFLFQDDQGIIRTAIYHESVSGDGYWEVWVWDQP